jgi:hypothetical protein
MYDESYLPVGFVGLLLTNVRTLAIIANLLSAALHGAKALSIYCKNEQYTEIEAAAEAPAEAEIIATEGQSSEQELASPLLGRKTASPHV